MRVLGLFVVLCAVACAASADLVAQGGRTFTLADGERPFLKGKMTAGPGAEFAIEGLKANLKTPGPVAAEVSWGEDAFLCRLAPGPDANVVQLSLGRVRSRLAHSLFSPARDDGVTFEGEDVQLTPLQPGV